MFISWSEYNSLICFRHENVGSNGGDDDDDDHDGSAVELLKKFQRHCVGSPELMPPPLAIPKYQQQVKLPMMCEKQTVSSHTIGNKPSSCEHIPDGKGNVIDTNS